jgi:tetratricopeptide (TPR) repeat protein
MKMKKWTYILAVISVLAFGISNTGWSVQGPGIENPGIENPGIINPAGLSTVPPSSLGDGLVTSPNPIDQSGNLAGNLTITGNVRRGRYFRGDVPYNSRSDFGAALGSSSLDSFLRDSAGYEDFGEYSSKYSPQPFFSRSKTVPTMALGYPGVFQPIGDMSTRSVPDVFGLEVLDEGMIQQKRDAEAASLAMRTTPLTPDEVRLLTSGQARITPESEPASARLYQNRLEQIRQDLARMRAEEPLDQPTEDKKEDVKEEAEREALFGLLTEPGAAATQQEQEFARTRKLETPFEKTKRLEAQAIKEQQQRNTDQDVGVLEKEKEALNSLLPSYEREKPGTTRQGEAQAAESMAEIERLAEQIADLRRKGSGAATDETLQVGLERTDAGADKTPELDIAGSPNLTLKGYRDLALQNAQAGTDQTTPPEADEVTTLSDKEVASRAKQIMSGHQSHESFSKARFKQYMAEAQVYMKQGKYYQAATAYDQAAIFYSKDPETMAGKALALFGAGDYISSALFLSRAIELSPEYARKKIDLAAAMGNKDKFETRVVDAEDWLEKSCAPELEFLLAYTYYCNGKLELAKKAITTAAKEMPNSKAVKTLKEAIDAAPGPGKAK